MHTLLPYSDDPVAFEEGEALYKDLIRVGVEDQLPPWGKIWVRNGKVICVLPTHPIEDFNVPPVLFIDESSDTKRELFFLGALAFRPLQAVLAVTRHIQNLVVLAQAHVGFWLPNAPPPRLHLRELTNPAARLNTPWKHVPRHDIEALFRALVPSIKEMAGLKLIAPIERARLNRVLRNAFPGQSAVQLQQLSIQLGSVMLRAMLSNSNLVVDRLEIVADHDHTQIRVGTGRRQATLHLLNGLVTAGSVVPMKADLIWDSNARYSSKFPSNFSLETMGCEGFPLRTLVESVGLQFIDVYLGLWRIINSERKPFMGVSSDDLGIQTVTNMTWADDLPSP